VGQELLVRRELRALFALSWPAAVTQVGLMLFGVIDTLMVARLGADELAASAIANNLQWSVMSIGMGAAMGIDALVSQSHGRGDAQAIGLARQRGLVVSVLISIPLCLSQLWTEEALLLLGQTPRVAELAERYNLLRIASIPSFLLFTTQRQVLQARGLMGPVTWLVYGANAIHGALNWALIFGELGAPALGLEGAAIASGLSAILLAAGTFGLSGWLGLDDGSGRPWDRAALDPAGLWQVLRLGLPVGVQLCLEGTAFTLAALMAGWIDVQSVSGHQIALTMAAMAFMLPMGVSLGGSARVGNVIGAGDAPGMRRAVWVALATGAGVMTVSALAFTVLRWELPRLFTDDAALIAVAAGVLPMAAAFQIADGTQVVAGGVLRAMGRPQAAAMVNLIGYYALALPLGYALGFPLGLGLPGIWIGLTIGLVAIAGALLLWVRRQTLRPIEELQVAVRAAGA
jgi:MATE family multidrug resistance protein